ncbi:helix-turn-helix transcriptional regulator [Nannocystis radixulma]|uniref:WYL domain-containing protein n=1 Tax=Nannocystis radixulma TaxID=2995305 RepID=A0ABT5B9H3_9BACT|nr:WYL domain-containing protein [Nannocystis radixulma]MDC0670270.1 WYL domain-containing protein [Nannocystis radixulma]
MTREAKPDSSRTVQETARFILRYLRENADGATKETLSSKAGVAGVTVQRALKYMREEWDAPLEFVHASKVWKLLDDKFTLPLTDPDPEDLAAVVFASALLQPVADAELNARVKRLVEQMDAAVEETQKNAAKVRPKSVTATMTTGTRVDSRLVSKLLQAVGSGVVRIEYDSPWSGTRKTHDIEPWQLRLHDGVMYMRAFSRTTGDARSFRVAQIVHARVLPGQTPREPVPTKNNLWGSSDPGFGIDSDRPGVATLRVRGGVARWIANLVWDPGQEDRWIEPAELLERKVPYHSCREFARRLLQIVDGLESIEPAELREEVVSDARAFLERLDRHAAPA